MPKPVPYKYSMKLRLLSLQTQLHILLKVLTPNNAHIACINWEYLAIFAIIYTESQ